MPLYELDSSWLSETTPLFSIVLSNSRVTLLPVLITSLRNDLLIYRLISRRWLPDASPRHTPTGNAYVCTQNPRANPDHTAIMEILYRNDDWQQ